MTLLDEGTYRRITGDIRVYSGTVLVDAFADAQSQCETWLRRPVESKSRTESVRSEQNSDGDWVLWPKATPVTVVAAGYTILDGASVSTSSAYSGSLTYTGGWTLATAPYVVLALLAGVSRRLINVRLSEDALSVDPEGNVVPVVPPFSDDDPDPIYHNAQGYRRLSGVGSNG